MELIKNILGGCELYNGDCLIKTFSNEGDLVVDLTMGSAPTGVACVNTNRRFIGIELDEQYYKISTERVQQAINEQASKLF